MSNRKKEILGIILILVVQTIIFVIAGINKSYIHMDEAYSLGLASYDKTEIQANDDFYNTWHDNKYYEDYLAVNDDEKGSFWQVYENQKNDVHPPFYYLLLRIMMGFSMNHYSKWPGIILNIVIYCFITVFMYLILKKLLKNEKNVEAKALILAFTSSVILASITTAIYIRMYALATLNIIITMYLHLKLLDEEKPSTKLLIGIGISALIGSLTHYYYLFFLAPLFVMMAIKFVKQKNYKLLGKYTVTMIIAAILSLAIFPYSIKHMFFGYRGQGAISNLTDISKFATAIGGYISKISKFAFNTMLPTIAIVILLIIIYKLIRKIKLSEQKNIYIKYLAIPTLFYFVIVAVASPWIELRYVMPICGIVFVLVMYIMYILLKNIVKSEILDKIFLAVLALILIMPAILNTFVLKKEVLEPEVEYSDKRQIVETLSNDLNVPTIYSFNSNNNRFLDDILLFAKINESYIAKDFGWTEENIKKIMEGKDLQNGIVVFINEGQENDEILIKLQQTLHLGKIEYLKRLNACDVYYIMK